jgi:uncharacterized protein (DUF1015 family)
VARLKPFKGIRYNPDRIASMADVVSPPYDVISEAEQAELHDRSPFNVIRMELGQKRPGDGNHDNPHTRARDYLRTWLEDGTLVQEEAPAVYLTATEFGTVRGTYTRWGLIVSVGLEPFSERGILPHERTYSKVKSERLALMQTCRANLSPIFAFFSDDRSTMPQLISHVAPMPPVVAFQDDNRHTHKMWIIKNPDLHALIAANFEQQTLFIADGHHRYETALAYRDELASLEGVLPENHPANNTLMYLSSIQDPGLMILPAHRLLPEVHSEVRRQFLEKAQPYFEVQLSEESMPQEQAVDTLLAKLEQTQPGAALVVALRDVARPVLLQLKSGKKTTIYPKKTPDVLKGIDVTLLTEFIFPTLLGLSQAQLDDVNRVHYHHDARVALESVTSGYYDMAFIIKATPIAAVQQIADAGQVMPRKSTYFAPKVITGLVIHALSAPMD